MNKDTQKTASTETAPAGTAQFMSVQDFADWGLADVAYIKPIDVNGRTFYGVFAANGRQLGLMENRNAAYAALFQNELEPVSLN